MSRLLHISLLIHIVSLILATGQFFRGWLLISIDIGILTLTRLWRSICSQNRLSHCRSRVIRAQLWSLIPIPTIHTMRLFLMQSSDCLRLIVFMIHRRYLTVRRDRCRVVLWSTIIWMGRTLDHEIHLLLYLTNIQIWRRVKIFLIGTSVTLDDLVFDGWVGVVWSLNQIDLVHLRFQGLGLIYGIRIRCVFLVQSRSLHFSLIVIILIIGSWIWVLKINTRWQCMLAILLCNLKWTSIVYIVIKTLHFSSPQFRHLTDLLLMLIHIFLIWFLFLNYNLIIFLLR